MASPPGLSYACVQAVQALRQNRRVTPRLKMLRGGTDDAEAFMQYLIEEPSSALEDAVTQAGKGFVAFLDVVRVEVQNYMQHAAS
jgi:hypothetical protein